MKYHSERLQGLHNLGVRWITIVEPCSAIDLQSRYRRQSTPNGRDRKAGDPALPHGSQDGPKAHFGCTLEATYHFPALRRSTNRLLLLRKAGKKRFLFQGKRRNVPFVMAQKEPKAQKREGAPLPFSIPSPLTNTGEANFLICTGFAAAAG